jgi:hypothetical protein
MDFQEFLDLIQQAGEEVGLIPLEEKELDEVVPLKVVQTFSRQFISSFANLMKELGFDEKITVNPIYGMDLSKLNIKRKPLPQPGFLLPMKPLAIKPPKGKQKSPRSLLKFAPRLHKTSDKSSKATTFSQAKPATPISTPSATPPLPSVVGQRRGSDSTKLANKLLAPSSNSKKDKKDKK